MVERNTNSNTKEYIQMPRLLLRGPARRSWEVRILSQNIDIRQTRRQL
jgi:hypothetical protein